MKEFLSDHGIVFTDYNVAEDPVALETLVATTGQQATPVVIVGAYAEHPSDHAYHTYN